MVRGYIGCFTSSSRNALAESVSGHCDRIEIELNANGSTLVRDNGRGIPVDPWKGSTAAEIVMTRLAAKKFDQVRINGIAELRGIGAAVVNALSEALELRIWRSQSEYFVRFCRGCPEAPITRTGDAPTLDGRPRHGTQIMFVPDPEIFPAAKFDFDRIEAHLSELAHLNLGVDVSLTDMRRAKSRTVVRRI